MSRRKHLVPLWAQISVGLGILALVALLSLKTSFYVSEWHTPNSSFYQNSMDALTQSQINVYQGPTPTLVVFWSVDCEPCKESIKDFANYGTAVNVVGIHLKTQDADKEKARRWWFNNAGKTFPIYFDEQNMLENTFHIRILPSNFLYFPLENKILSHVGNLSWAKPSVMELATQGNTK